MSRMSVNLVINSNLCLRDPAQTELGRKIIQHGVLLIDELGIDEFNFKKLAQRIKSTEASIYRYFENKQHLFIYLINYYWEWVKFRIEIQTMNVIDPIKKMKIALSIIADSSRRNMETPYVDEDVLHNIVVREGIKAYHSKSVDEENKEGYFLAYKALCKTLADIVLEINPTFKYPKAFASMILETANNNIYFAQHLPRLTDLREKGDALTDKVVEMLEHFVFKMTKPEPTPQNIVSPKNGVAIRAN